MANYSNYHQRRPDASIERHCFYCAKKNVGPFIGAYEMVPRGRIFYNPDTEVFTIAVGSWIEQYPQAIPLIVDEFNLGKTEYVVKTAQHWDIGQKWD